MTAARPRKRHGRAHARAGRSKNNIAGIRTRDKGRKALRSGKAQRMDTGIVWYCSAFCLSRCGLCVYAGPL